jgi:hypothetical protein
MQDRPSANSMKVLLQRTAGPYIGSIASGRYFARGPGMSASRLKADKEASMALSLLCAKSACERMQHRAQVYSITSSAVLSSDGGTVRPIIRAVSALITSSNFVDCRTGKSAGFAPLRMRPA